MTYLPIMYRTPNYVIRTCDETVTYPNGSSAIITYVDWVGHSKSGKATTHLRKCWTCGLPLISGFSFI